MSQRKEFVKLAQQEDANIRDLCKRFEISPTTAYKWLERFGATGEEGLADLSRRPHNSPYRTQADMEHRIVELRDAHPAWGGRKLRRRLIDLGHGQVPSPSAITAILNRNGRIACDESSKHKAWQRFEHYGQDTLDAIGLGNRPMYISDYVEKWIPAMPDVLEKLNKGARVAEVGCGVGWSSISLAKGFPNVHIDGIDKESVRQAQSNALGEGVADRIVFHASAIENCDLTAPYDLVTAFECLHDMPYPLEALKKMRELAGPNGTVLIADEAAEDTLEGNSNFLGHLFYNFSVLHCLPQAMVFPNGAETGTVIKPSTVRKLAYEAGFSKIDVLPIENPFWRFNRLTP